MNTQHLVSIRVLEFNIRVFIFICIHICLHMFRFLWYRLSVSLAHCDDNMFPEWSGFKGAHALSLVCTRSTNLIWIQIYALPPIRLRVCSAGPTAPLMTATYRWKRRTSTWRVFQCPIKSGLDYLVFHKILRIPKTLRGAEFFLSHRDA